MAAEKTDANVSCFVPADLLGVVHCMSVAHFGKYQQNSAKPSVTE